LSHQVKGLEVGLALKLFVRRSKTAKASPVGVAVCLKFGAAGLAFFFFRKLEAHRRNFMGFAGGQPQAGCISPLNVTPVRMAHSLCPNIPQSCPMWSHIRPGLAFDAIACLACAKRRSGGVPSDPENLAA